MISLLGRLCRDLVAPHNCAGLHCLVELPMPSPLLLGAMLTFIGDLVQPGKETAILESRKKRKGTAHDAAISLPPGGREALKIVLEDHFIGVR